MNQQESSEKKRGAEKFARNPVKIIPSNTRLKKAPWIKIKASYSPEVPALKQLLRQHKLVTVCEEASCPNLNECFSAGTATFMIMGDICTRRCSFCDVAHGRPKPLNPKEPFELAATLSAMQLRYVVITSVDRDDLPDGGAQHFVNCIQEARKQHPHIKMEILVPDFRGRQEQALTILGQGLPDVFNHNIETVPRLYKKIRPGSSYQASLELLQNFKKLYPHIPTKSGLMLGIGEEKEEIITALTDLRQYDCDRLTMGQYLQPSKHHAPVERYVTPEEFQELADIATDLGFDKVTSGPMVRSSYHAAEQDA
jgi:lipoyl synthase